MELQARIPFTPSQLSAMLTIIESSREFEHGERNARVLHNRVLDALEQAVENLEAVPLEELLDAPEVAR